jgi:predicted RNase H-like HicB family nuclease
MHNEFNAIVEYDDQWHVAYSPEIPGANGQGRSRDEALQSLREAIALILEDRRMSTRSSNSPQLIGLFTQAL